MSDDYYKALRIDPKADAEVIKAAYRRLARRLHPDVNPGYGATERMIALNEAYEVLSDPVRRAVYDRERFARALRSMASSTPEPIPRPPMSWDAPPPAMPEEPIATLDVPLLVVQVRWRVVLRLIGTAV